jgi:S1-C subfamily serine protease
MQGDVMTAIFFSALGDRTRRLSVSIIIAAVTMAALPATLMARADYAALRHSVVKIYATTQRADYALPWRTHAPQRSSGSGFVIKGKRILTNAHVISNARYLEVKRDGDPRRFRATVAFAGHDCDLAILTVDDDTFFKSIRPVEFASKLPSLSQTVTVLGYPLGGQRLSLTEGVVSRIDNSTYSHSGIDAHLVLQVDAAINPGNSGGPVFYRDRVVGVAFQGITRADNIGYAIPVPIIRHFLDDVADGHYHGYPELGVLSLDLRNKALARELGLPQGERGVVVTYVDPFAAAANHLQDGDVLLEIDGHDILEDGTVLLDGNHVQYTELMERKQWGESIAMRVWRAGASTGLAFALDTAPDPFIYRNLYDQRPRYLMVGGLVFAPLSREYLKTFIRKASGANQQQLLYVSQYVKMDGLYQDHDEFIVLVKRLAHPVNTYTGPFLNGIVTTVNGQPVRSLAAMQAAIDGTTDEMHIIGFSGMDDELVLPVALAKAAAAPIMQKYGVPAAAYMGEKK